MTAWIALGLTVETATFVGAALAWLHSEGYTLAEAVAGAVLITFMFLSLLHQVDLAAGSVLPGMALEIGSLAALVFVWRRWLPQAAGSLASIKALLFRETLPGWIILASGAAMAGLVAAQGAGVGSLAAQPLPDAVFVCGRSVALAALEQRVREANQHIRTLLAAS